MPRLGAKIRKATKRRIRALLKYALRKLDESDDRPKGSQQARTVKPPGANAKAAKADSGNLSDRKERPTTPSARPSQSRQFVLDADQAVDIGCVKVFRAENFPSAGPVPWLDRDDANEAIATHVSAAKLSTSDAKLCRKWREDGYVILEGAIPAEVIDATWAAYEAAVQRGRIKLESEPASPDDPFPGRYLNPHFHVPELDQLLKHETLVRTCELVLGRKAIPFQTITSHKGSQQGAHSDSIHMTTYPLGYLAACWIAMEDIHPDSGPLCYFPRSHRAPYIFSKDVGISFEDFRTSGYGPYHERYEPAIRNLVHAGGYPERLFEAKKGDVLFWHANLIHGGSVRRDLTRSRKAVVCHYYSQGCICYHDLSGSPSHLHGPVEKLPVCGAQGN